MLSASLVGAWWLVSYHDVLDAHTCTEGPLGPAPRGLLLYNEGGYMSVGMMRSTPPDTAPADNAPATFMGYAGTWRLVDGSVVVHDVHVSAHPQMVGTEQFRDAELDGDRLILSGLAVVSECPRRRRLTWQRFGTVTR